MPHAFPCPVCGQAEVTAHSVCPACQVGIPWGVDWNWWRGCGGMGPDAFEGTPSTEDCTRRREEPS